MTTHDSVQPPSRRVLESVDRNQIMDKCAFVIGCAAVSAIAAPITMMNAKPAMVFAVDKLHLEPVFAIWIVTSTAIAAVMC